MTRLTLELGKGINRDQPPFELAPGYWSDCQNMRFRNGCDERVGGISSIATPSVAPYGIDTFDVGSTSGVTRFIMYAGLAKVYAYDGSTTTEITRGLNGTVSNATGTGATITITTVGNHGLSTGDNVIVGGMLPATYNTPSSGGVPTGANITVTGATTFTFAGTETAAITQGGFWESNRTSNFTASAGEEITCCNLNGIWYFNTLLDGCYFWVGTTTSAASSRLRRVRTQSAGAYCLYARAVRPYKDYLFALGYLGGGVLPTAAPTSASLTKKPFDIAWGASADPGSTPSTFIAASSNDAGMVQKTRGALVDAQAFGETLYIYQDRGIIATDYIGGNDIFSFRYLQGTDGLAAPNCIASTPDGQFFFSQNKDLKVHTGGAAKSVAEGKMRDWIAANIDSTNYVRSFLRENKKCNELWLCIPGSGNSTCTRALLYNYAGDTWGERDLSAVTCGAAGMLPTSVATDERLILGTTTPRLGLTESGTSDFGSTITSMVERVGMTMGNPSAVKNLQGSRWQFDGTAGQTGSVYHGSAMTADAAATYASAATVTLGTSNWVNAISTGGRYLALKMTTTGTINKWRSVDLDYMQGGEF